MSTDGLDTAVVLEHSDLEALNRTQLAGQLAAERVERLKAQLQLAELTDKETKAQITQFNQKIQEKYGLQNGDSMDLSSGAITRVASAELAPTT